MPSLTSLDLSNLPLVDEGAVALASALPALTKLNTLTLTGCGVGDVGGRQLSAASTVCEV